MSGGIYSENIWLVRASFMEMLWSDLLAGKRYLACTKERKRYAVWITSPSKRARNSGWARELSGSSKSICDTLSVYRTYMDHHINNKRKWITVTQAILIHWLFQRSLLLSIISIIYDCIPEQWLLTPLVLWSDDHRKGSKCKRCLFARVIELSCSYHEV